MQTLLILTACAALMGSYLNSSKRKEGFLIWMVTNSIFMVYNFFIGEYAQTLLFACSLAISINGWFQWNKKEISS